MNKFIYYTKYNNPQIHSSYQAKYLCLLMLLSLSCPLQAMETQGKLSSLLYGSIISYIGAKALSLKQKSKTVGSQCTLVLHKTPYSAIEESNVNVESIKLKDLYLRNYELSKQAFDEYVKRLYPPTPSYMPQASLVQYSHTPSTSTSKRSAYHGPSFRITPYNVLKAGVLFFGMGTDARQIHQAQEITNQGGAACGLCIAACCSMLALPGVGCIYICVTGPCSAVCLAPTP